MSASIRGPGDTRETGLRRLIADGATIYRATRRLKWPGEAAVVVSVVHLAKQLSPNERPAIRLDGREAPRISAFLVASYNDDSPRPLKANEGKAFQGSIVLGMGFTFDDKAAAKGVATSLAEMHRLIEKDPRNGERIKPYLGGEEVNIQPRHEHHRYVIDFEDFPLCRDVRLPSWNTASEQKREGWLREGVVPADYDGPVAADWPDLLEIVERLVRPERLKQNDQTGQRFWWRYLRPRPELHSAIDGLEIVTAVVLYGPHMMFVRLPTGIVYSNKLGVIAIQDILAICVFQNRTHEVWARLQSATLKDDLAYSLTDAFETFPIPPGFGSDSQLEAAGRGYHDHRARIMAENNEGLTKTYNRFHDPDERDPGILELRRLHAAMDDAVLRAYGWEDLADEAEARHLTEATEAEFAYQGRFFWPAEFRDRVLARLLDLNRERAAEEQAAGGKVRRRRAAKASDVAEGPLFARGTNA